MTEYRPNSEMLHHWRQPSNMSSIQRTKKTIITIATSEDQRLRGYFQYRGELSPRTVSSHFSVGGSAIMHVLEHLRGLNPVCAA